MPMERITLRIPEGLSKVLDNLVVRAARNSRRADPKRLLPGANRSEIAREALARGLYEMGKPKERESVSDNG